VFSSSGTNYTATVPNGITGETVTATLSDSTATITGITGTSGFAVGANTITVAVTAQDGVTTMLYTVVVTCLPSSNATLSSLALSSGTLTPIFSSSGTNYTSTVPNEITGETVTVALSDSTATLTAITGTSGFAVGANTISVTVTAQDGITSLAYSIVVTRLPGNYTVSLAGNPICGQLNGGGAYSPGTDTTVTAIPNKAYRFVCWTENGNPVSTSTNYTFTMNGDRILTATFQAQTYSAWAASTFTATQLADSSVSGAPATPAGDGIPNLLKYAFNCNSLFPSRTVLPSVSVEGGFVTLTYVINSAATDLTFIAEVSGDMVTWNSGAAYTTAPALVTQDDQTQTLKASDLIPASTGQGRFIRLRLLGP